jgi:hypothetical protein
MMHHIRPYQIFERLIDTQITVMIPTESSAKSRSVMMLETALLIAVARQTNVSSILEIGTAYGYTALHLARNTDANVTTVDIDSPVVRMYKGEPEEERINEVCADSKTLPTRSYQMIFIDGDHSASGIMADTKYAFQCSPSVVAWHDYGNADYPDVKPYLDKVSDAYELFHVNDSWLVFWFREGLG